MFLFVWPALERQVPNHTESHSLAHSYWTSCDLWQKGHSDFLDSLSLVNGFGAEPVHCTVSRVLAPRSASITCSRCHRDIKTRITRSRRCANRAPGGLMLTSRVRIFVTAPTVCVRARAYESKGALGSLLSHSAICSPHLLLREEASRPGNGGGCNTVGSWRGGGHIARRYQDD